MTNENAGYYSLSVSKPNLRDLSLAHFPIMSVEIHYSSDQPTIPTQLNSTQTNQQTNQPTNPTQLNPNQANLSPWHNLL